MPRGGSCCEAWTTGGRWRRASRRGAFARCRAQARRSTALSSRDWFEHEYTPVVEMLRDADLLGEGTEAEAYLRVGAARYRLLGTHEWSEEIVDHLRGVLLDGRGRTSRA